MKRKILITLASGLAGALAVCFMFWCGGYNFDHRGEAGGLCAFCSACAAILAMIPAYIMQL